MKNFFLIFGGNVLNRGVSEKFAKNLILVVDPRDTPDIDYDFHLQFDVRNFKEILNYLKTNSFDKDNFKYKIAQLISL